MHRQRAHRAMFIESFELAGCEIDPDERHERYMFAAETISDRADHLEQAAVGIGRRHAGDRRQVRANVHAFPRVDVAVDIDDLEVSLHPARVVPGVAADLPTLRLALRVAKAILHLVLGIATGNTQRQVGAYGAVDANRSAEDVLVGTMAEGAVLAIAPLAVEVAPSRHFAILATRGA